ncbi:MAG: hypothetical protein QW767_02230 [Thermoprotei archaeon]
MSVFVEGSGGRRRRRIGLLALPVVLAILALGALIVVQENSARTLIPGGSQITLKGGVVYSLLFTTSRPATLTGTLTATGEFVFYVSLHAGDCNTACDNYSVIYETPAASSSAVYVKLNSGAYVLNVVSRSPNSTLVVTIVDPVALRF